MRRLWDQNRMRLTQDTKRVEAAIVNWWSAAGRKFHHWCLALTSAVVSHRDQTMSLRFRETLQVGAPAIRSLGLDRRRQQAEG